MSHIWSDVEHCDPSALIRHCQPPPPIQLHAVAALFRVHSMTGAHDHSSRQS